MGFDLSNAGGGYFRLSGGGWGLALTLAEQFGWRPAGTPRPSGWDDADGPWRGEYAIQAGQQVTAADAAAFAAALERAIASDQYVPLARRAVDDLNALVVEQVPSARDDVQPLSDQDAEGFRKRLLELVSFARQGAFVIE